MHLFSFLDGDFQSFGRIVQNRIILTWIISNIFKFHQFVRISIFLFLLVFFSFISFHFQYNFLLSINNRIINLNSTLCNSTNLLILYLLPLHNILNKMIPKINLLICFLLLCDFQPWEHLLFYDIYWSTFD